MKINRLLTATGVLLMAFSCGNPNLDAEKPFSITYNILNRDGTKTNTVKQGENFIFSLIITNNSDEEWYVDHGSLLGSDLAMLYSKSSVGNDTLIGRAYDSAICSFQAGVVIPANGHLEINIPWIADQLLTKFPSCGLNANVNRMLPAGWYAIKLDGKIIIFRSDITYEIPLRAYNSSFQVK
ncbi:hypothetical protein [Dyadobacter sp. NIV53]|uniref:hypothetical protein n=1 Tax=Dyadobacter sp. NIV53 TaxID=2861765 RepID=UPI001C86EAD6|nr:hypothetical protein [Dyadobacter sp. NIV53]